MVDPKTEAILREYRKDVEKLARGIYLQGLAIKKELSLAKVNPEDRLAILMHTINLLTAEDKPQETNK